MEYGHGPAHKRARPMSPAPRERERERYDGPPRKRFESPNSWDRERPVPARRGEEEKPVVLPPVVSWFMGQLPAPQFYDGMCVCNEA